MKYLLLVCSLFLLGLKGEAQGCCSGGSGSPIAGGASQGVLLDRQMEIALSHQYINTNRFFIEDHKTIPFFDKYTSNYLYLKVAYGITKDFTVSVESGYFANKTQIGRNHSDTIKSAGIGDLIIFPKYDIYNRTTEDYRTEVTLGLGLKIPLGKHDDSTLVYTDPTTGQKYYTPSPPTVQPTNGSNDFIFYGFAFRGYSLTNFKIFTNVLYIRKGWNSLGQKFGDYASVGLFAAKTFYKKLGVTLQVKGEWVNKMQYDKNIDMLAIYNIDVHSTGSRKLLFVPQLSFSQKKFTVFALTELPLYQYVNGTQVGSKVQTTVGISYRFYAFKSNIKTETEKTSSKE